MPRHTSSLVAREGDAQLNTPSQSKVQLWWPFVLLVLAGASRWAVAAARPAAESTLASQTIGCAWAALLALAILLPKRKTATSEPKPSHTATVRWLLAGAMLFGGPAITLFLPAHDLDSSALTIALALTPIIIAIAASALGTESSDGIAGRIWPGLASVAGLLLVLVQPTLGDLRTDLALALAPTLTGIGAVLFCVGPPRAASRLPTTLFGASTLFAIALAASRLFTQAHPSFSMLAVAGDGTLALLGGLTLNQLGVTRWSSQFTWVPLLIILEGIILVRAHLTAHWFIGLILLIVAGVYLLMPQGSDSTSETSPIPTVPG
jgi:drug/metabolite transporter (DMT)-like permease